MNIEKLPAIFLVAGMVMVAVWYADAAPPPKSAAKPVDKYPDCKCPKGNKGKHCALGMKQFAKCDTDKLYECSETEDSKPLKTSQCNNCLEVKEDKKASDEKSACKEAEDKKPCQCPAYSSDTKVAYAGHFCLNKMVNPDSCSKGYKIDNKLLDTETLAFYCDGSGPLPRSAYKCKGCSAGTNESQDTKDKKTGVITKRNPLATTKGC